MTSYPRNMNQILSDIHIGLGVGGIGEGKEAGVLSDDDYVRSIRQAFEIGYRLFDTAEAYSSGRSERLIGSALGSEPDAIIATKVSPENLTRERMQKSAESSLKRLARDYIDLYQIHWPNPDIAALEVAEGLSRLYEMGLIRSVGVCNYNSRQAEELRNLLPSIPFVSSQVELSLVDQFPVGRIHDWARREGVITLAYSPLGKGRISEFETLNNVINEIASTYKVTNAQVSLSWLSHLGGLIPIPASRNPTNLRQNFNFSSTAIPADALKRISDVLSSQEVVRVPPQEISVALDGEGSRAAYTTLEEALENRLDFCPSPQSLSREILLDSDIKPVRIQQREAGLFLIEGRVRYWAWVIAFGFDEPLPCTIVKSVVQ